MAATNTILVTGMSGLIGGVAGRALNRRVVVGFETAEADIVDYDAIRPAFDGIDTVIHLAAYLGADDQQQLIVNVTGTYNVFEAARDAGHLHPTRPCTGGRPAGKRS